MTNDGAKARLRGEVLEIRESLSPEERRRSGEGILSRVLALPEYAAARSVLAYCGFGAEIGTSTFLDAVLRDGKRLVLPRVDREEKSLVLHRVEDTDSGLLSGTWGIMEPDEGLPVVAVPEVDFALVPGVAFDREGGRLGYGGGYYDRMLGGEGRRPVLVAAAFDEQVVPSVPVDGHDIRVDVLVTPGSTLRFGVRD